MGTLDDLLKGKSFGSLEEVNAFLNRQMQQRSSAPLGRTDQEIQGEVYTE